MPGAPAGSLKGLRCSGSIEPGGIYEFHTSTDLRNWTFNRNATASTFAVTSITQPSTQPRFFYGVARQQ